MPTRLVPVTDLRAPTITLQRPVLLIGRHAECDVRIDRAEVSRLHCCVALAYERLLIRDLGSRNGVRVNGKLVDETRLFPGDEIAIAHLLYRLEADPAGSGTRPAVRPPEPPALAPTPGQDSDEDLIPLVDDDF